MLLIIWQNDDNGEDVSEDEKKEKDVDGIGGDKLIQTAKKKKSANAGNAGSGTAKGKAKR